MFRKAPKVTTKKGQSENKTLTVAKSFRRRQRGESETCQLAERAQLRAAYPRRSVVASWRGVERTALGRRCPACSSEHVAIKRTETGFPGRMEGSTIAESALRMSVNGRKRPLPAVPGQYMLDANADRSRRFVGLADSDVCSIGVCGGLDSRAGDPDAAIERRHGASKRLNSYGRIVDRNGKVGGWSRHHFGLSVAG